MNLFIVPNMLKKFRRTYTESEKRSTAPFLGGLYEKGKKIS